MYFLVNLNHHPLKQSFDGKCSNYTLCPRSLDPFYLVKHKMDQDFLDRRQSQHV